MKMCRLFAVLALVGLAAAARDHDTSPVEKVVGLLKDLQAKMQADGKAESQMYNKYACWCETTTARKAKDITNAENDLRSLGQQILKLKGKVATLAAEIQELTESIESNAQGQGEATAMREKNNGQYQSRAAETKQAIAALEKAIDVLVTGSSLMQTDAAARLTSAVQNVVNKIPSQGALSSDRMVVLSEFLQNGADSKYAPQSATIQGILQDMYATFAGDLEEATMTEAKQNKNYEKLTATLIKQANEMKDMKSRSEDAKADAESDLADATATYDTTQDQMKADIKFFDQTKDACETKHKEWTLRDKLRDEEMAGVQKALEMLTSDKARDLFASSIKPGVEAASFLQIDEAHAQAVYLKAYSMLRGQAVKSKSLRLAALAVRVRSTKAGHFDAVITAIDTMINTLNDEGAADRAKKNQCNEEYQNIAQTVGDLDWKLKNNKAKINKLESLIELRQKEREETIGQINDTDDYIKKITEERGEEHDAFVHAKQEDEAAVKLLNAAKDAFTAYYKKNGVKMGKIQGAELLQADPAFEVSEDQAPEASFSGKGSSKVQSKGIVTLMEYIIQDLEDEITNGGKNEATSQAEFEAELNTAKELVKDLKSKQSNLEDQIANRKGEKTDESKDMGENNKDRDAELSYKDKITPDCDWIKKNFDGRATARDAEMSGLVSAKEFLAGKASLLQVEKLAPAKAAAGSSDRLANIGFLGLHH